MLYLTVRVITRFETPKALASYSGLTPGLEQSGVKLRGKGITKEGRRELRWAMVEVAWRAVRSDPHWKQYFDGLKKRMHTNQVIACPGGLGQGGHCPSLVDGGLVRSVQS